MSGKMKILEPLIFFFSSSASSSSSSSTLREAFFPTPASLIVRSSRAAAFASSSLRLLVGQAARSCFLFVLPTHSLPLRPIMYRGRNTYVCPYKVDSAHLQGERQARMLSSGQATACSVPENPPPLPWEGKGLLLPLANPQ